MFRCRCDCLAKKKTNVQRLSSDALVGCTIAIGIQEKMRKNECHLICTRIRYRKLRSIIFAKAIFDCQIKRIEKEKI